MLTNKAIGRALRTMRRGSGLTQARMDARLELCPQVAAW